MQPEDIASALLLAAKAARRAVAAISCDAEVSRGAKPLEARIAIFIGGYVSTPTERNASISFKGDSLLLYINADAELCEGFLNHTFPSFVKAFIHIEVLLCGAGGEINSVFFKYYVQESSLCVFVQVR